MIDPQEYLERESVLVEALRQLQIELGEVRDEIYAHPLMVMQREVEALKAKSKALSSKFDATNNMLSEIRRGEK